MNTWLLTVMITLCRMLGTGENANSNPNLGDQRAIVDSTLWLPATFAIAHFDQNVSEQEVVECEILGTKIVGISTCEGKLVAEVDAESGCVEVRCLFQGVIESVNTGTNGPVTIESTTSTSFSAVKTLEFDGLLFTTLPVELEAKTTIKILRVDTHLTGTKGMLVKRIAANRAEASREEVRGIAEELTKKRLCEKIDKAFERQLSRMNFAMNVCRYSVVRIGSHQLRISTRCIDKSNLEVGFTLMTANCGTH